MTRIKSGVFARIGLVAVAIGLIAPLAASAANVTGGTLTLSDSRPGQTGVSYTFSGSGFSTGTTIECIDLELNTSADGSGTTPAGVSTTGSTLASSTLVTGWSVNNSVQGSLRITNATGSTHAASGNIVWNGVTNGTTADTTYYGIFNTYSDDTCTTGVDTTTVAFIYKDGALVSLTVDPMLEFTVAGVADSETVNGANITLTSTASAINFARSVTAAVNGVSAHDLTVETNGSGFTVYLKQSGNLSNGSHTITPWTGTNGGPTPISGTGEMWAYTTQDSSLGGGGSGPTRFTSASNWAGMPTVNELVADSTSSGASTTRVGHQLGIDSTTPAGNYSTTLTYTAAGSY